MGQVEQMLRGDHDLVPARPAERIGNLGVLRNHRVTFARTVELLKTQGYQAMAESVRIGLSIESLYFAAMSSDPVRSLYI